MDHLGNMTTRAADIVLPSGTIAESQGTLVNNEGRAQRYYNVFPVKEPVLESWRWIKELMLVSGKHSTASWQDFESLVSDMMNTIPAFGKIKEMSSAPDFIMLNEKIPRQTLRMSGRTAVHAHESVHEQAIPKDNDSPLAFSMEGYKGAPPPSLIPEYWSPGWNSVQALYKYTDEPNGHIRGGDPGVRLIDDNTQSSMDYFVTVPPAFQPENGRWWLVPVYYIFGSDELSAKAAGIAQRIPEPEIFVNKNQAEKAGLKENLKIQLVDINQNMEFRIRYSINMPEGVLGIPVQFPGMFWQSLPGWSKIK